MMDKAKLFERRIPEADVTIDDLGTFRIRGLTRGEAMAVADTPGGTAAKERLIVSLGCIDPVLSIQDVKRWQENSLPEELELLTTAIASLSKMLPEDAKEETVRFPDGADE